MNDGQAFRAWLAQHGYSPRTVTLYGQYADRAARHIARPLARARERDLHDWWITLPSSASSRNGARHALIAWYRYRGRRDGGPARLIDRVPAPTTLPRPVPEHDYEGMLAAAAEMGGLWETFASLLAYTGCRMSEAARARWTQLELDGEHPVWYVEGKGARRRGPKVRVVPLNAELVDVLHRWRATSDSPDWLFPSDRSVSGHLHQSTLQKRLSEVCEAAEIQRATAHRWRHSVATIALQRTGDLRGVQSLLGHASLATTQIYTKVIPDQLRALVDALGRPA